MHDRHARERRAGPGRCAGRELSEQADPHRDSVRGRRLCRHHHAGAGRQARRAAGPAGDHREPSGRRRRGGGAGGDLVSGRRLHAVRARRRHRDQRGAVQVVAVRRPEGLRSDLDRRAFRHAAADQVLVAGPHARRSPGRRAQARGRHEPRHHAGGQLPVPGGRAVPLGGRHQGHPGAVPHDARRAAGAAARRHRCCGRILRRAEVGDRRRPGPPDRLVRHRPLPAGCADRRRERPAALRSHRLERAVRAGGHAAARSSRVSTRRWSRPWRCRRCASA